MIHNLVHSKIFLRNNNQTPNRHTTDNHYQQTSPKNLYKHLLHQVVLLGNSLFHNADIFNDRSLPGCKYPMEYLSIALFATSIKILSRRGCGSFWMSLYCACAAWHKIMPKMINNIRFMILLCFVIVRGSDCSPESFKLHLWLSIQHAQRISPPFFPIASLMFHTERIPLQTVLFASLISSGVVGP